MRLHGWFVFCAAVLIVLAFNLTPGKPSEADATGKQAPDEAKASVSDGSGRFDALIKPYLEQHCIRCHGPEKQKGKVALHHASGAFGNKEEVDQWLSVLDMLSFGDMPPVKEKQPDPAETAKVVEWIKLRLEETGKAEAYQAKLIAPAYGNYVSHEELFSGEIKTPPYSPARFWRFSSNIFEARSYGKGIRSPFTYVTSPSEIRDYSAMSGVDRSTVQMILLNTEQWFEKREEKGDFKDFSDDDPIPNDQTLKELIQREFKAIIRRAATDEETARYVAFLNENIALGGNLDGLRTTLTAMFLSPESIYRMEFGMGPVDEHGRRHLAPEEIAYALAYALTDQGPDDTAIIRDTFKQGTLNNREDVARVVQQLLDENIGKDTPRKQPLPRIMRFFDEYFGFHRANEVFKDNQRRRLEAIGWGPQGLIRDARQVIQYRLREDEDVIARLLTGNEFYIAHNGDSDKAKKIYEESIAEVLAADYVENLVTKKREQLEKREKPVKPEAFQRMVDDVRKKAEASVRRYRQAIDDGFKPFPGFDGPRHGYHIVDLRYIGSYNLPPHTRGQLQKWAWEYEQPIELPKDQRAGILTHPAWLGAHSWNDGNDPIHRGIWVQKKLLAGVIHDVPPDVDAQVPVDPHKTLRERMEFLRAERCWNCHRKINPLGEPFEMFDDFGRYRTHDYFDEDGLLVTRRDGTFECMLKRGKLTKRPIDASGEIKGSGDPSVDGEVENAVEMMNRLGRSDRARQSFIRHLFRYFMGRNERLSDSITLIEAEQAYLENGGSFKALVVSLLSSDSFLYRR